MGYNFRDHNPNQLLLLAPKLDDCLPQEHMARLFSDVVDSLDLKPFLRRFRDNVQGGLPPGYNAQGRPLCLLRGYPFQFQPQDCPAVIADVAFRWLWPTTAPTSGPSPRSAVSTLRTSSLCFSRSCSCASRRDGQGRGRGPGWNHGRGECRHGPQPNLGKALRAREDAHGRGGVSA